MSPTADIRSILVATDFSETSEAAGRFARWLAERLGAQMVFAHVSEPVILASDPLGAGGLPTFELTALASAGDARSEAMQAFAARHTPPGQAPALETPQGRPADVLPQLAATLPAPVIVMGTHGRTGAGRLFFGSVAESMLRHADCPVIIVRGDAPAPAPPLPPPSVVLVATHFSQACGLAADQGVHLSRKTGAKLEFLHVIETDTETFHHGVTRGERGELERPIPVKDYWHGRLEAFVGERVGPQDVWHAHVEPGWPQERIAAAAEAASPALLCIGTHRHSALGQLLGSTAASLIRRVRCPVLTVRGA